MSTQYESAMRNEYPDLIAGVRVTFNYKGNHIFGISKACCFHKHRANYTGKIISHALTDDHSSDVVGMDARRFQEKRTNRQKYLGGN